MPGVGQDSGKIYQDVLAYGIVVLNSPLWTVVDALRGALTWNPRDDVATPHSSRRRWRE